jgi:hypothetical protein
VAVVVIWAFALAIIPSTSPRTATAIGFIGFIGFAGFAGLADFTALLRTGGSNQNPCGITTLFCDNFFI